MIAAQSNKNRFCGYAHTNQGLGPRSCDCLDERFVLNGFRHRLTNGCARPILGDRLSGVTTHSSSRCADQRDKSVVQAD